MASNGQPLLRNYVICWLTLYITLLHSSSSINVHLSYTRPKVKSGEMPDELNITLSGESGTTTFLHLKRTQLALSNLPVYTLGVDENGKFLYQKEVITDNQQNVGYYQDVNSEANFQISRVDDQDSGDAHLIINGYLIIDGQRYELVPDERIKRDAEPSTTSSSSSSLFENVAYSLLLQDPPLGNANDYLEAPPEVPPRFIKETKLDISQFVPSSVSPNNSSSLPSRNRRQSVQTIDIDIVAFADFAIFSRFMATSGSRTNTLQAMREYFAFMFNGIDLRYQGIVNSKYAIRVHLVKLIIAESSGASLFVENFRQPYNTVDRVDAYDVLPEFSKFAAGYGRNILYPYDHAMLFTGYDLTSSLPTGGFSDTIVGLAYISTLCRSDGTSTSIIQDFGGLQAVHTATHELGHSLSAEHDGSDNFCRAADRYIMSPGGYTVTESNKLNYWIFSFCSINSFSTYIDDILRTPSGIGCLTQQLPTSSDVPDVSDRLPGQEYTADDQCRMLYGNSSKMCRGKEFGLPADICTSMYCSNPRTPGICYQYVAVMGTTCGNGKLCMDGKCVEDSRAPTEDCVFGDEPGIVFDGQTCAQFVSSFSGYCYQDVVRNKCCKSCEKVYRSVAECEYGNTVLGCFSYDCLGATTKTLKQCCETCNYGSPLSVTQKRTTIRYTSLTTKGRVTSTTPVSARSDRSTIPLTRTTASSACVDRSNTRIFSLACAVAIGLFPFLCSRLDVLSACCLSCRRMTYINRG
uniref:Peptidase M12B domain-containing protein n=1 Tax=Arion vulgaris TaxID=1028688 RepID=A0A0B6Z6Y3_9EUPU